MYKAVVAGCFFGIALTPAPAATAQEQASTAESELNRMICRRDAVVGSRVQRRRTCMTRREWIKLQEGTRDGMNEFLRKATQNANPN